LLVLNYGKSDFRLVLAHYHLGEAYLGFECIEQAIEHLSLSLHKIEKLTPEVAKAELVQVSIMITLAEAFMAQPSFDDALDTLNKAEDREEKYNQQVRNNHKDNRETVRNVKILVLKAQCYSKQRHFQ
jgi:tetratricopeptide (TPR) repeat protein